MTFSTARLCDAHYDKGHLQITDAIFQAYGANKVFSGQISTVKTFEDNVLVRAVLEEKVENRILVVDGGGSHRCALIDAPLVQLALDNGWQGIIINGCIRDSATIDQLPIGIRALGSNPLKSHKKDHGDRDLIVSFAGVNFKKDQFLYADTDGIIVSESMLS